MSVRAYLDLVVIDFEDSGAKELVARLVLFVTRIVEQRSHHQVFVQICRSEQLHFANVQVEHVGGMLQDLLVLLLIRLGPEVAKFILELSDDQIELVAAFDHQIGIADGVRRACRDSGRHSVLVLLGLVPLDGFDLANNLVVSSALRKSWKAQLDSQQSEIRVAKQDSILYIPKPKVHQLGTDTHVDAECDLGVEVLVVLVENDQGP